MIKTHKVKNKISRTLVKRILVNKKVQLEDLVSTYFCAVDNPFVYFLTIHYFHGTKNKSKIRMNNTYPDVG